MAGGIAVHRTGTRIIAALLVATTLAGCAKDMRPTGSIRSGADKPVEEMTAVELQTALTRYGDLYDRNPKDKRVGMAYASVLRMNGRNEQALAVMRQVAIIHSTDRDVLAAYGKALAGAGEFPAALDAIRRAQTPDRPDWKLMSAEGAILDQTGDSAGARELYRKALQIRPSEPTVLSNLAMSHLLEGDLKTAEGYLADAVRQPGADSRVRQNYAMVVGLQGRFDEAERIARQELSPEQAEANVAYLRKMLTEQNAWSLIKKDDKAAN